jgi:RimJ/RimL family protein N-acetyltransferase
MDIFLETERLILRRLTLDDAANLYELDNDPDVMRFINGGQPADYEVIRMQTLPRFLACYDEYAAYGFWAAIEKSSGEFIGWFHFRPGAGNPEDIELGYRLHKAAWGKGYATEGSRALIRKGFTELGTQRVVAHTLAMNTRSRRVMEKAGLKFVRTFTYEGTPGAWHVGQAAVAYALDKQEWTPEEDAATRREDSAAR